VSTDELCHITIIMLVMLIMLVMIPIILIICMLLIILYHPSIIQVASVRLTVAFIGRGPLVKGNVVPWLTISSHFPGFPQALDESKHGHRFVDMPRDPHAWLSSP
jgi:hypothetical protein